MIQLHYTTPSEGDTHLSGTITNSSWNPQPTEDVTFRVKIVYTNGSIDLPATEALVTDAEDQIEIQLTDGALLPR